MTRTAHRFAVAAVAAAALTLVAATPPHSLDAAAELVRKGPPWISIEYPANPHDPGSRGAFLLVNTFHHGTPTAFPINGRAEGVVNGERRTQQLEFRRTSRTGVFALHRQWQAEGTWVLVISTHRNPDDGATALVSIGRDGSVAAVDVPSRRQGEWTVPRAVTSAEVEALLARRVAAH